MAAMKPRTGDGPMEVAKEGRVIVMRVPLEGGGRLVVALNSEEAADLGAQFHTEFLSHTRGEHARRVGGQGLALRGEADAPSVGLEERDKPAEIDGFWGKRLLA